jgi:hypothetical protein
MSNLKQIIEEIRAAAAPFAGANWEIDPDEQGRCVYRDDDDGTFLFRCDSMGKSEREEEAKFARYIAATSPARILALLAPLPDISDENVYAAGGGGAL